MYKQGGSSRQPDTETRLLRRLLDEAGYDEDSERLGGDPELQAALADPEFRAWLSAGAPGSGAATERVTLTRKGYRATDPPRS